MLRGLWADAAFAVLHALSAVVAAMRNRNWFNKLCMVACLDTVDTVEAGHHAQLDTLVAPACQLLTRSKGQTLCGLPAAVPYTTCGWSRPASRFWICQDKTTGFDRHFADVTSPAEIGGAPAGYSRVAAWVPHRRLQQGHSRISVSTQTVYG